MKREKATTPINEYGLPNIVIPAELIFNENLNWRERALFGFINNLAKNEFGYAWASNRFLGRYIGCTPQTASGMISKLQDEGYLILEYETTWDGRNVRRIYIDNSYTFTHAETLKGGLSKIKSPLKQTKNPPKANKKPPLSNSLTNLDSDLDSDLDSYNSEPFGSDNDPDTDNPPKENSPLPKEERNKEYLPQAEKLANIIRSIQNIKVDQPRLKSWTNEIRKLAETDGVGTSRIDAALSWYADNVEGEYVPVVESGSTLRQKFIKLEAAIKREKNGSNKSQSKKPSQGVRFGNRYPE